jgi:16S rRNA (guanine527-N7)-methyltransferase
MTSPFDRSRNHNTTRVVYVPSTSITEWLVRYHVTLTELQIEQVQKYTSLLVLWNQKISLTSIENPQEIVSRHFGESFFGAKFVENPRCRLADVGSGAGFPGLALKIALPELQVSLIEQDIRKATFLNEVIRALNLQGIKVFRTAYESLAPEVANFDVIVARAVGNHKSFLNWAGPRLSSVGQVLLWLGAEDAVLLSRLPGWQWQLPHALPESKNRVLLSGTVVK